MPNAEIITIGTEILLGEIIDTNAAYLARALRQAGIDLYRKTSVGDNVERIAQAIRQGLERSEIIITTGGLGPTVDDPTREAVAAAFNRPLEYRPELWNQILDRFRRFDRPPTENNKRQAYIPAGAEFIENPVGTAPCFRLEQEGRVVISLPGVPLEMEYLIENNVIPYLKKRYPQTGVLLMRTLRLAGAGESIIDERIGELEKLSNPTVGLAAHAGQLDVRMVVKAATQEEAVALLRPVEEDLRRQLEPWIYGVDDETLEGVALHAVAERGWKLFVLEAGLGGSLLTRIANCPSGEQKNVLVGAEMLPDALDEKGLLNAIRVGRAERGCEIALGVSLVPDGERQQVHVVLITPAGEAQSNRPHGGPPKSGPTWAANQSLNMLRNFPRHESGKIII